MARPKKNIILPVLKDYGGDMSKPWYIDYSIRNVRTDKMERTRISTGFAGCHTLEERYALANELMDEIKRKIQNMDFLEEAKTTRYNDELLYANAAERWGNAKKEVVTIRTYLSEFLQFKRSAINAKSMQTYRSKCRIFCEWSEHNRLSTVDVATITNANVCDFLAYLAKEHKLSRLSIDKYAQILRTFFDYLIKHKGIDMRNPVHDIPKMGAVVDDAARPIPDSPRRRLMNAIKIDDPQLYLMCEFEYYCAIRPNECRLMKVGDIDFDLQVIRVRNEIAKNNQTDIVRIPTQLLEDMMAAELHLWPNKEDYIFSRDGKPGEHSLGFNTLRNRFNKIRDRLGLSKAYKLYSLKHTGAVKLSEAGVSTWELQEHFRHRSIATTEQYLKNKVGVKSELIENEFPDL